jgi:ABC-type transport system substrate-binding protein
MNSAERSVTIEIDEDPLSLFHSEVIDYVGTMVRSALFAPLGTLAAAGEWNISKDRLVHTLRFAPDAKWSDGRTIEPQHFLRTFGRMAKHPYWSWHLRNVRELLSAPTGALRISLHRPLDYISKLLCSPYFAPQNCDAKGLRPRVSNGPYTLRGYSKGAKYRLSPNEHYPGGQERPDLCFVVNRKPHLSPQWFDRGHTHVSCNTGFPYEEIEPRRTTAEFHREPSPIWMQLDFNPERNVCVRNIEFRRALFHSIDRPLIAKELHDGLVVAESIGPGCFPGFIPTLEPSFDPRLAQSLLRRTKAPTEPLIILYNDYYPNRMVLERICGQWRDSLGVKTQIVAVPFCRPARTEYDLMMTLRVPVFDHVYAALEGFSFGMQHFSSSAEARRFGYLLESVGTSTGSEIHEASLAASGLIFRNLVSLPLFQVQNLYMIRPEIQGFRFPQRTYFEFANLRWLDC